jgi:leucyl/phenylalanyl-tRNA--protein transferase
MPLFMLPVEHLFPDPNLARDDGLLAIGGDLAPERVLLGYSQGIFPWYSEDQPVLWHSPDPRFVLFLDEFRIGRSLKKTLRKMPFEIRMDTAFERVLGCTASAWEACTLEKVCTRTLPTPPKLLLLVWRRN